MPHPENRKPEFPPQEYSEVLAFVEPIQVGFRLETPILVGGQAVNLWAKTYSDSLPTLRMFQPYVSIDADLFGGKNMAAAISRRSGWSLSVNENSDSIIAATLTKKTPAGLLEVDVLREVPGVSEKEIKESSKRLEIEPGKYCQVPAPSVLLKAKVHNLANFHQERSDGTQRNDIKHVRMLVEICPHYARHLAENVRIGNVSEQELVNELARLKAIIDSPEAKLVAKEFDIGLEKAVPRENLPRHEAD